MQKKIMTVGNWISYLFFLAVWIIIYIFYQSYELLAVLIVLIALVPAGIAAAYIMKNKIQLSCAVRRKQAEKGQSFIVDFTVDNPTILVSRNIALTVEIENTFIGQIRRQYITIPPRILGKKQVSLEYKGLYCGMIQFRIVQCEVRDWLGMVLLENKVNIDTQTAVMPNLNQIQVGYEHLGRGEGHKDAKVISKKGDDVSEITQIRGYVPGDRLQNIHWKLSSKSGDFLVKDYSTPVNNEITMLLDFRKLPQDAGSILDNVLELFFSSILYLCESGQEMYACWFNGESLTEERIAAKEELTGLIYKIYEGRPAQGGPSAYDCYSRLYSQESGNILYFCAKEELPEDTGGGQDIQAEAGEAVAIWL